MRSNSMSLKRDRTSWLESTKDAQYLSTNSSTKVFQKPSKPKVYKTNDKFIFLKMLQTQFKSYLPVVQRQYRRISGKLIKLKQISYCQQIQIQAKMASDKQLPINFGVFEIGYFWITISNVFYLIDLDKVNGLQQSHDKMGQRWIGWKNGFFRKEFKEVICQVAWFRKKQFVFMHKQIQNLIWIAFPFKLTLCYYYDKNIQEIGIQIKSENKRVQKIVVSQTQKTYYADSSGSLYEISSTPSLSNSANKKKPYQTFSLQSILPIQHQIIDIILDQNQNKIYMLFVKKNLKIKIPFLTFTPSTHLKIFSIQPFTQRYSISAYTIKQKLKPYSMQFQFMSIEKFQPISISLAQKGYIILTLKSCIKIKLKIYSLTNFQMQIFYMPFPIKENPYLLIPSKVISNEECSLGLISSAGSNCSLNVVQNNGYYLMLVDQSTFDCKELQGQAKVFKLNGQKWIVAQKNSISIYITLRQFDIFNLFLSLNWNNTQQKFYQYSQELFSCYDHLSCYNVLLQIITNPNHYSSVPNSLLNQLNNQLQNKNKPINKFTNNPIVNIKPDENAKGKAKILLERLTGRKIESRFDYQEDNTMNGKMILTDLGFTTKFIGMASYLYCVVQKFIQNNLFRVNSINQKVINFNSSTLQQIKKQLMFFSNFLKSQSLNTQTNQQRYIKSASIFFSTHQYNSLRLNNHKFCQYSLTELKRILDKLTQFIQIIIELIPYRFVCKETEKISVKNIFTRREIKKKFCQIIVNQLHHDSRIIEIVHRFISTQRVNFIFSYPQFELYLYISQIKPKSESILSRIIWTIFQNPFQSENMNFKFVKDRIQYFQIGQTQQFYRKHETQSHYQCLQIVSQRIKICKNTINQLSNLKIGWGKTTRMQTFKIEECKILIDQVQQEIQKLGRILDKNNYV